MRCNPLRWLWGLIPIALLTGVAVLSEHKRIEQDLASRVSASLEKAGLGWATSGFTAGGSFTGRDGILSGLATEDGDPQRAYDIARNVWGVRQLDNQAGLIEKAETYVWSAALRDTRVRLSGFVPNEEARRTIVGVAKATFPGREIQDLTKLARGVPQRDSWLGAVSFSLKQLAGLKRGTVDLEGTSLSIEGEAEDSKAYRAVKSALANTMPQGVRLKSDKVRPPVVSPYVWSANHSGRQIILSGLVPDDRARERQFALARSKFPRTAVVDRLEVAAGEPRTYEASVRAALAALATLEEGQADLRDQQLSLTGLATNDVIAEDTRKQLRTDVAGVRVSDSLRVKEVLPKPVSPFTTAVVADASTATVTGYVPNEPARAALIETVKARLPGRRVVDQLQLAGGAPDGWQACTQAALLGLGRLGAGRMQMTDRQMVLTGSTRDPSLPDALSKDVRAAANRACDSDVRVAVEALPEPDLNWKATLRDGTLVLDGEVPDVGARADLVATASRLVDGVRVVDRMVIRPAVSTKWQKVAELGLRQLARLRSGEVVLNGQTLSVTGEAADTVIAASVREQLGRNVQPGYTARDQIAVRSDAMIWAEQEARRKAEADAAARRQAAEEEARRKAEADAAARRQAAEEEARRRAEAEARQRAETEARLREQAEARRVEQERQQREQLAAVERQRRQEIDRCKVELSRAASEGVINFKRASADLEPASTTTLDRLAQIARQCPIGRIEVEGHTDAEGTVERNQRLSQRRAQSVRDYLVRAGVDATRITAIGYGAERPIAPNDTPDNMAKNRRIEFEVRAD